MTPVDMAIKRHIDAIAQLAVAITPDQVRDLQAGMIALPAMVAETKDGPAAAEALAPHIARHQRIADAFLVFRITLGEVWGEKETEPARADEPQPASPTRDWPMGLPESDL